MKVLKRKYAMTFGSLALMLSLALSFAACGDEGGENGEGNGEENGGSSPGTGSQNDCFPKSSTDHWRGSGANPFDYTWGSSNFDATEVDKRRRVFANNGSGAVYHFNANGTYSYYVVARGRWADDTGSYKISEIDGNSKGTITFFNRCRASNVDEERTPMLPDAIVIEFQLVREVERPSVGLTAGFIDYIPAHPSQYHLPDTLLIIDNVFGSGQDLFVRQP